jgi:hypothetical protein
MKYFAQEPKQWFYLDGRHDIQHNDTQHNGTFVMLSVFQGECHLYRVSRISPSAECRYDECHYAECSYAECHYVECHYAECRSALTPLVSFVRLGYAIDTPLPTRDS